MLGGYKKKVMRNDTTQKCSRVGNNQIDFKGCVYLTDGSSKVIK
jgi:hypothetical protein